jgi:ergothioneine biosynthesis protein EgtB
MLKKTDLLEQYKGVREHSENICTHLSIEDYVVQPIVDVSPPKWHLGHTTWFFETFILKPHFKGYKEFDSQYNFVFNSYYETVGARVIRTDRGNLSRPSVADVYAYRRHVDENMIRFIDKEEINDELAELLILGLNHEQQHQELLLTDIKYILGHNPLFPAFRTGEYFPTLQGKSSSEFHAINGGVYEIGFSGEGFSFDNEHGLHKVYLNNYSICESLVTNGEYLEFINDRGYEDFRHWHAEGWDWVNRNKIKSPLYWHRVDGVWMNYTFDGLTPINILEAVCHVSFYEASAYAAWKGKRSRMGSCFK